MDHMTGSTFRTSRIERDRRRRTGPSFTLVTGGGAPEDERETPPWHPAQEGFTPDGTPGDLPPRTVPSSEPGTPTLRSTSRGSASPDKVGTASPGSGPIDRRAELLDLVARFLDEHAGDDPAPTPLRLVR